MTCQRNIITSVLYDMDCEMTKFYTLQSMDRLKAPWDKSKIYLEQQKVLFFLLLERDIELKNIVLEGIVGIGVFGVAPEKAERFFLSLKEEVIDPWLCNEELSNQSFLDSVASLYWSC